MATPVGTAPLGRRDNFPYQYLEDGETRVVTIKRHSHWPRANTLTCTIKHINVHASADTRAPYVALSYTWGDGRDVQSLKLQDESTGKSGKITVTSDLLLALHTILSASHESRQTLWIDQICIDQSDAVEKGRQVLLMRWIYEKASLVFVWLGTASDDSDDAMAYLESCDQDSVLRDLSDSSRSRFTERIEAGVRVLLGQMYWTRTWTIQEATAISGSKTLVFCGNKSVELDRFSKWNNITVAMLLNPPLPTTTYSMWMYRRTAFSTLDRFQGLRQTPSRSLYALVVEARALAASDPRDKIYSMLSFATDILLDDMRPDYAKTVRQTYTELVLWFIDTHHNLDILGDCYLALQDDNAPSWVPDWGRDTQMFAMEKTSQQYSPNSNNMYNASGKYVSDVSVQKPYIHDTELLQLSGLHISDLQIVQNHLELDDGDTWTTQRSWEPLDGNMVCPLTDLPVREVFRRTIYLDIHFVEDQNHKEHLSKRGNDMILPWYLDTSKLTASESVAHIMSRNWVFGRCPFHIKSASASPTSIMGYGPETAEPGDELWILKGGKVPYLLRPKPMTIPSTDLTTGEARDLPVDAGMPTYKFVGEAFVLGLMDGEIIDMMGDNPKRERPAALAGMDREFRTIGLI